MTYADEIDGLARALAELVSREPSDWAADPTPSHEAFAVRDIVATRLRTIAAALVHAPAQNQPGEFPARHVAADPGHALHAALADLPRAGADERPVGTDLGTRSANANPWQQAAQACLFLEPYTETLRALPGPQAWSALRGVADLAAAVVILDEDLSTHHRATHLDLGRHGALRIAADELRARVAPDGPHPHLARRSVQSAVAVRTVAELPWATGRLAAMLDERGPDITAVEVRAAARMLVEGLATAARATTGPQGIVGLDAAMRTAAAAAQRALCEPMATLTQSSPPIRYLAGQITVQVRALGGVLGKFDADPADRTGDRAVVAAAIRPWVAEAAGVAAAVDRGLRASHQQHLLLGHPESTSSTQPYRWIPAATPEGQAEPRALTASRSMREALAHAARLATEQDSSGAQQQTAGDLVASTALPALTEARRPITAAPLPDHPANRIGRRHVKGAVASRRRSTQRRRRGGPEAPRM